MTSIRTTNLIWLRMFEVAKEFWKSELCLAIMNDVGKTRTANFGLLARLQ